MVKRARSEHRSSKSSYNTNRKRCFNIAMKIFTLILYCFVYIEKINGDTFPNIEALNVSSIEQQELYNATIFNDIISSSDVLSEQSSVVVNDANIPTTTNTTEQESQQSSNDSLFQHEAIEMSPEYFTQHDDDYTYDDDVTFITYENDISASPDDFRVVQEPRQRESNISKVESVKERIPETEIVDSLMNETSSLPNVSALDVNVLDAKITVETIQQLKEDTMLEQTISEQESLYGLINHDEEAPGIEAIPPVDLPLLENSLNYTTEINLTEANNVSSDSIISATKREENTISDHSVKGTFEDEGPRRGTENETFSPQIYQY
jgi:hypothetical protein